MNELIPYSRLSRRIRAVFIDGLVLGLSFYFLIYLVTSFNFENHTLETLTILFLAGSIEPFFVSYTGASVGHHLSGIKIRRISNDQNLNLLFSYLRFLIKIPLGLFSLVTVLMTRKHQAIHDLIVRSVVVLQSPDTMPAYESLAERHDDTECFIYPSKVKRFFVIVLYWLVSIVLNVLVLIATVHNSCLDGFRCTNIESVIQLALSLIFWIALFLIAWLGWAGKLFGARRRAKKRVNTAA